MIKMKITLCALTALMCILLALNIWHPFMLVGYSPTMTRTEAIQFIRQARATHASVAKLTPSQWSKETKRWLGNPEEQARITRLYDDVLFYLIHGGE